MRDSTFGVSEKMPIRSITERTTVSIHLILSIVTVIIMAVSAKVKDDGLTQVDARLGRIENILMSRGADRAENFEIRSGDKNNASDLLKHKKGV